MEEKQLQAAIRAAFYDVVYPGDDNIGDPEGRDDAESIAKALRGVTWRRLALRKALGPFGLYFMTPEAAQYYLPAYLLVSLKHPYGHAIRAVKLRLRPYDGPYPCPKEIFSRFVALLSLEQKEVVHEFLIFARQAMEDFCRKQAENDNPWFGETIGARELAEFDELIKYWSRA